MLWLLHRIWQRHKIRPSVFFRYREWDQKFIKASEWVEYEDDTGTVIE